MKLSFVVLLFVIFTLSCKNSSDINASSDEERVASEQETQIPVFYADPDTEKQRHFEVLFIDNEEYHLRIEKYCLNDSLLTQDILIDGEESGKLRPAIQVYHNYEAIIHFGKTDSDPFTIFRHKIDKELFKDSLDADFFEEATIFNVLYHSVRSNRIYFHVILSVPDSDWQEEFQCAVYFRTRKDGQLDYWKK